MSYLDPKTLIAEYKQAEENKIKKLQHERNNKFILQVNLALTKKGVWIPDYRNQEEVDFAEHLEARNGVVYIDKVGVSNQVVEESINTARLKGWIILTTADVLIIKIPGI